MLHIVHPHALLLASIPGRLAAKNSLWRPGTEAHFSGMCNEEWNLASKGLACLEDPICVRRYILHSLWQVVASFPGSPSSTQMILRMTFDPPETYVGRAFIWGKDVWNTKLKGKFWAIHWIWAINFWAINWTILGDKFLGDKISTIKFWAINYFWAINLGENSGR